jgi:response regulator RpfG family c-di-GMP phosphodiesterase
MPTVLCLDDFTCGLYDALQLLRENGYRVLATADDEAALELASDNILDAVILNCHQGADN